MRLPFFTNGGVLGLNARNLLYVKPFNPRKAVAFADDKMKTKAFLSARGIPTAKLFARIDNRRQLAHFDFSALPDECVLKPNYGFGGEGIIILKGRKNGVFLEQGKTPRTKKELVEHIEDILDGKFSVNGREDSAFFEQILVGDDCFTPFRPAGLPDIRIIVFNLVPVMAMLRVPTSVSGGKANVHLGGIGIGIDIAKGVTTYAAQYHSMIQELSHGTKVSGIEIPHWEELLLIASKIQYITNIGYLAVDLTIDSELGPVLLEVNARAGLMVQVANLAPLRSRLERVGGLSVSTPEKGVRLAQELFGEKIHDVQEKEVSKKPVLSSAEMIEISGDGFTVDEPCVIATDREDTVFDTTLIRELREARVLEEIEEGKNSYRVKFTLAEKKIQTIVHEGSPNGTRVIIGRRDLTGFLIDPSKKPKLITRQKGRKLDLRGTDHTLSVIDRDLSVLKYLRPINLEEELSLCKDDRAYNPTFLYRELPRDIDELQSTIEKVVTDDTVLGTLLGKKRGELLQKIALLRARGHSTPLTKASIDLYGKPTNELLSQAKDFLSGRVIEPTESEEEEVKADTAKKRFEHILAEYGLHDWQVVIRQGMVADCAVGDKKVIIREGALFTETRLQSLIAHEIETHAITAENGGVQPYEIFRRGLAHYIDTQEGLAIWNQNRVLPLGNEKRFRHALNVLGVEYALTHSFAELRHFLEDELKMDARRALMKAVDMKRGISQTAEHGAFTKSLVYFRGLKRIEAFVQSGGDLRRLYIGKITVEDIDLLAQIDGLKPPVILPHFLRTPTEKRRDSRQKKSH